MQCFSQIFVSRIEEEDNCCGWLHKEEQDDCQNGTL